MVMLLYLGTCTLCPWLASMGLGDGDASNPTPVYKDIHCSVATGLIYVVLSDRTVVLSM